MSDVPTFAVVGAVNHGKSSVVSALAEDDRVQVSAMPGETVATRRFALGDLLVLVDTPGFQNARKAAADLDAHRRDDDADDPLAPFRRFVARRRDDPSFDAECRLLQPVIDGAGIVYVVDASRPPLDLNTIEMDLLRRTGAPRLAIVNRTGPADHAAAWKGRLDQHFNLVREFDAHAATFGDRRELIESLAGIERRWKAPLATALAALDADHARRVDDAAASIARLVVDLLGQVERVPMDPSADAATRAARIDDAKRRYLATLVGLEAATHRRIVSMYAHRRVVPATLPVDRFEADLFADETWRLFGLDTRQLIGLSTVAGGVAGAGVDALTLGHSLGAGAAVGALAGAGGAFALGRRRPDVAVRWPAGANAGPLRRLVSRPAWRVAGGDVEIGPIAAENFPWIVLDRAFGLFAHVVTRSHARRDADPGAIDALQPRLDALGLTVRHWDDAARRGAQRVFRTARAGREPADDAFAALRASIGASLRSIVAHERSLATSSRASARGDAPVG